MNRLDSIEWVAQLPERVATEQPHDLVDDFRALVAVARAAAWMLHCEEQYLDPDLDREETDRWISTYDEADEALRDALKVLMAERGAGSARDAL